MHSNVYYVEIYKIILKVRTKFKYILQFKSLFKKKCKIALLTKVSQAKSTSFFEVSPFFTKFPSLLIHWHFKSFFHLITSCLNLHELESTKFYLIYLCTSLTRIAMLCVHIYQVVPGNVFAFSFSTCLHVPKEFSGLYIYYAGGHP